MDASDRQVIHELFARLGEVERTSGPRDVEAEALIRQQIAAQPAAPYYMAQAIVMQEHALRTAQERIAQLEREMAERPAAGGGFLSSLFGGGRTQPATSRPMMPPPGYGQQRPLMPPGATPGGGGFLAGAAQTAAGVAGGMLLGNLLAGMFSPSEAAAADASPVEDASADAGADEDYVDEDEEI